MHVRACQDELKIEVCEVLFEEPIHRRDSCYGMLSAMILWV